MHSPASLRTSIGISLGPLLRQRVVTRLKLSVVFNLQFAIRGDLFPPTLDAVVSKSIARILAAMEVDLGEDFLLSAGPAALATEDCHAALSFGSSASRAW
jgi:hypothetical protein